MYTQAATAMATMLATTTTAIDDPSWSQFTLALGLCLMGVALVLLTYSIFSSDDPAPGSDFHKKQRGIRVVMLVIGLTIAIIGINAL